MKFCSFINLPWGSVRSQKNLGPIGSAILTFIGYKQTNRQTDKPNLFIDFFIFIFKNINKQKRSKNYRNIFVFGSFLVRFWVFSGSFLSSYWFVFGSFLVRFWIVSGSFSGRFWFVFESFLVRFLPLFSARFEIWHSVRTANV